MFTVGVADAINGLVGASVASLPVGVPQRREAAKSRDTWQAVVGTASERIQIAETIENAGSGAGKLEIGAVGAEMKFIYKIASECSGQADGCTLRPLVSG